MEASQPRPRLQRSASERPAPLRRSSSFSTQFGWGLPQNCNTYDDEFSSEDERRASVPAKQPSAESLEEAKRARKQKMQRLFKQGVSKVVKERAEEMDDMAKKASLYVMDAFAGRLQHGMAAMSTKSPYIFAAFRLQISACWMWTIIVCSVAHSLLVFVEPRPGRDSDDGWLSARSLCALEVVFIAVYALDVALKVTYMGLKNYVKKPWQKLMIAIVLTLAVDASGVVGVRFARALRPAILSLRTRSIRRFYTVVSNMLPGFLRVCLPVLFFLLLSASYAASSFGRAKSDFESPVAAGYAIWILMVCADNYEALVNNPSEHPAYIPFVVMVIVVGSMFLLSLLLGVTYDVFIEHTTEQVKSERLKELKGLNMAFATMDPKGTGKLSMVVWERFLLHLMPRTTKQERALYFEIASGFADDIDVLGFMELRQVLSYSFVNVTAIEREGKRQKWEKMPPLLAKLLQRMGNMLHVRSWQHTVAAVVVLDCLLLPHSIPHQGPGLLITRLTAACGAVLLLDQAFQLAEWMRVGSGPGPLRLPGKSMHTKVSGVAVILHIVATGLVHCPPIMSLACSTFSWLRGTEYETSPNNASFGDFGESGSGGVVHAADGGWEGGDDEMCPLEESFAGEDGLGWGLNVGGGARRAGRICTEVDWCTDWFMMLAYTIRLLRCWRLVTLNDTLHDHVNTFFSVVPVFAQTLSFALIVAYAFAMVAMQAFAEKASAFRDAGMSLRTTLQLFVGVDFSAVVEGTVDEVGYGALVFFVAYHVVGVLIVFNLLTAIMIQLYGEALNEKSRQGMEEQREADQELQDSLCEHFQKKRVLRLWGRGVTQGTASLNITREAKVNNGREARRVLGSATKSHTPTADELKLCQRHAKVDLLRALREKTRGDNSLRTFERSFYQKLKSAGGNDGLTNQKFSDGDIIFSRGEQNPTCFFVHKGVVRLEAPDGTMEIKEKGEMFGEEALVASLMTGATAVAEGDVECMGMDRATFTETHGTLENLGLIFLRLQRSGSLYTVDAPPSDGSREGSRRSCFSSASGRSMRTFSTLGNSQIDFSGSDLQIPERWRSRRNVSSASARKCNTSLNVSARDETSGDVGDGAVVSASTAPSNARRKMLSGAGGNPVAFFEDAGSRGRAGMSVLSTAVSHDTGIRSGDESEGNIRSGGAEMVIAKDASGAALEEGTIIAADKRRHQHRRVELFPRVTVLHDDGESETARVAGPSQGMVRDSSAAPETAEPPRETHPHATTPAYAVVRAERAIADDDAPGGQPHNVRHEAVQHRGRRATRDEPTGVPLVGNEGVFRRYQRGVLESGTSGGPQPALTGNVGASIVPFAAASTAPVTAADSAAAAGEKADASRAGIGPTVARTVTRSGEALRGSRNFDGGTRLSVADCGIGHGSDTLSTAGESAREMTAPSSASTAPLPRWTFRPVPPDGSRQRRLLDVEGNDDDNDNEDDAATEDGDDHAAPESDSAKEGVMLTVAVDSTSRSSDRLPPTSPVLSPSVAPMSRKRQMLKVRSCMSTRDVVDGDDGGHVCGVDEGADGVISTGPSAAGSSMSTWSTNSPSPVLTNAGNNVVDPDDDQ